MTRRLAVSATRPRAALVRAITETAAYGLIAYGVRAMSGYSRAVPINTCRSTSPPFLEMFSRPKPDSPVIVHGRQRHALTAAPDGGSHPARSTKAPASTKAGLDPLVATPLLLAKSRTAHSNCPCWPLAANSTTEPKGRPGGPVSSSMGH